MKNFWTFPAGKDIIKGTEKLPLREAASRMTKKYGLPLRLLLALSGTALCVLMMQTESKLSFALTGLLALGLMLYLTLKTGFLEAVFRSELPGVRGVAAVLTLSTLYTEKSHFYTTCCGWLIKLLRWTGLPEGLSRLAPWVVALLALPMAFGYFLWISDFLWEQWLRFWRKTDFGEQMYLLCAGVLFAALIVFTYSCTEAFYGAHVNGYWYNFDLIYSADSGYLVHQDVFRNVGAEQNDLRQPLFGLFSMPFAQAAWLISRPLFFLNNRYLVVLQIVEMWLFLLSGVMIARMLELEGTEKLLFLAILSVTFPVLIFSLTAEQYLMAIFWLILLCYLEKDQVGGSLSYIAATGSMLTSGVFFPLVTWDKKFTNFVKTTAKLCAAFFGVMILSGRLTTFLDVGTYIEGYGYYAGGNVAPVQKLMQFVNFVGCAFLAPASRVDFETYSHVSWQMEPVTGWRILGFVVLAAAVAGVLVKREKRFSKICAGWMGFSLLLLGIVGWGTIDNGLMLYSLYFSWAYVAMCFQFVDHVLSRLRPAKLTVLGLIFVVTAIVNFAALKEVLLFAAQFFPALR